MPTTTTNYSFNKPTVGGDEDAWGGYLNGNWDTLDTLLGGVTNAELAVLDGATLGSVTASKVVTADANGDVTFPDGEKAIFGTGSDLQIFHDGSNSYINELGTGDLYVRAQNTFNLQKAGTSEYMLKTTTDGAVELYNDDTKRLETTSGGVHVTGSVTGDDVIAGSGRSGGVFIDGDGLNSDFNASARTASVTTEWATVRINQQAAYTGLKIFGDSSQTANYFEISDSSGTDQFKVSSAGDVEIANEIIAGSYNETYGAVTSSSNATTVDCEAGNAFSHTLTENTTFTFSNPPASGTAYSFSIEIIQDASASGYTVTWPSSVDWPSATAPTLTATASAKDVFVFYTRDGGTNWYGFTAGQALG